MTAEETTLYDHLVSAVYLLLTLSLPVLLLYLFLLSLVRLEEEVLISLYRMVADSLSQHTMENGKSSDATLSLVTTCNNKV